MKGIIKEYLVRCSSEGGENIESQLSDGWMDGYLVNTQISESSDLVSHRGGGTDIDIVMHGINGVSRGDQIWIFSL